jgi:sortase A
VRGVVQVLGELLATAGVLVLLFTGYLVYGTSLATGQEQRAASDELDRLWAEAPAPPVEPPDAAAPDAADPGPAAEPDAPPTAGPAPAPGRPAAASSGAPLVRLHVPRFGRSFTVLEGTSQAVLARGPGHYPRTALPGQVGNTAIAGHRVTRGSPFQPAGSLVSCDALVVESRDTWWIYRVLPLPGEEDGWAGGAGARGRCAGVAPIGVPGRQIVPPSDRSVIADVPGRPGEAPTARLLTLTTCHPLFSARERLIVHAVLVRAQPRAEGRPAELGE